MFKFVALFCLALAVADASVGFGSFQKPNSKFHPRIIGGENAKIGQFPWQVSLQLVGLLGNGQHYCGGSILTPKTILTAGHCVTEVQIGQFQHIEVKAGLTNFASPEDTLQVRKVSKTIVHPNFDGGVAPNDLAIHILDKPLDLNDDVQAVNLPAEGEIPEGDTTLSGWGSTSTGSLPSMPTHLQFVDLPIVNYEDCSALLEGQGTPFDDTMVCTGPLSGGYGACSGDSGGPLITGEGNNVTQVGIVSWGFIPCGQAELPSVFTRVSEFVSWINDNTVG